MVIFIHSVALYMPFIYALYIEISIKIFIYRYDIMISSKSIFIKYVTSLIPLDED